MKFISVPVEIEATQWFKHGDHPEVGPISVCDYHDRTKDFFLECCRKLNSTHGKITTVEGPMRVCPGDWIITGTEGEHYPCKPVVFAKKYRPVSGEGK